MDCSRINIDVVFVPVMIACTILSSENEYVGQVNVR
jgi:hypothetical protein